jgi:hypothetical protein
MTGTLLETFSRLTPFARSCSTRSTLSRAILSRGHVMDGAPDGTFSPASRSASCTGCAAAMKLRSWPSLTAGAAQATGGLGSERPSNFRIQRPALRAAAAPRSPQMTVVGVASGGERRLLR